MKKDINKIIEEICQNDKTLYECKKPHQFEEVKYQGRIPLKEGGFKSMEFVKYICKLCGGKVNIIEKFYYELGLKDGKLILHEQ